MSRSAGFATICAVLALASSARANDGIAIMDMQGTGVDERLLPILTEVLTAEIDSLGRFKVIAGRDIQAMLGFEKQKDMVGCTEASCLAEIGGALGADRLVAGQIGKVGNTYVVNIKLINIRSATTEGRVYETVRGQEDALLDSIRRSVGKLFHDERGKGAATARDAAPERPVAQVSSALQPEAPPEEVHASVTPGNKHPVGSYVLMGVGVVGLGTGLVLGLVAHNQESCAKSLTCVGAQLDVTRAPSTAAGANAAFAVGGASLVGGIIWFFAGSTEVQATAWEPLFLPAGAGIAYNGHF